MTAEWNRTNIDLVPGDGMEITVVQLGGDVLEATFDAEATGVEGSAGAESMLFFQEGEVTLATGSEPTPFPYDAEIIDVQPFIGTPPTVTDVQVDVLVNNESVWTLADDRPIIPATQYTGDPVVPDTTDYDQNDLVTVDITQVGAPSSGGGVTPDVRSVSTGFNTFTSTVQSLNIPIPPAYQQGDLLVCFILIGAQTISDLPDDWVDAVTGTDPATPVEDEDENPPGSIHLYTLMKIAESNESALQVVTLSGGTPAQAVTLAISNPLALIGQPDDSDVVLVSSAGTSATLPAITSTEDNDIGVWAYGLRLASGAQDTITLHADFDLTTDYNDTTTRAAATNLVLAVAHQQLGSAQTTSAYQATSSSGRWAGQVIAFFEGPTGDTPGENLYVKIRYRERV